MIGDWPCVDPKAGGGEWRSKQTTSTPRLASRHEVAAPIAPPPITATFMKLVRRYPGDWLSGHDEVAHVEQQGLDHARERGRDLGVRLVCVHLRQGLSLRHLLSGLLSPRAHRPPLCALQLPHP